MNHTNVSKCIYYRQDDVRLAILIRLSPGWQCRKTRATSFRASYHKQTNKQTNKQTQNIGKYSQLFEKKCFREEDI